MTVTEAAATTAATLPAFDTNNILTNTNNNHPPLSLLADQLHAQGFDICHPFHPHWYNDLLEEEHEAPSSRQYGWK